MTKRASSRFQYNIDKYRQLLKNWVTVNQDFINKQKINRRLASAIPVPANELFQYIHTQAQPIFVLSTGRCGTKFITKLFEINDAWSIHHSSSPVLSPFSNYAFHHAQEQAMLVAFDAARYELIRNEYLLHKRFIETNHRITFFAYAISQLYPKAKFIHLYRHAYEFCQSGLSRKWYSSSTANDEGRLTLEPQWNNLKPIEKIAGLWCETNLFIQRFSKEISGERFFKISSEDLFSDEHKIFNLLNFMDDQISIERNKILSIMKHRINAQPAHRKSSLSENHLISIDNILKTYGLKPDANFD